MQFCVLSCALSNPYIKQTSISQRKAWVIQWHFKETGDIKIHFTSSSIKGGGYLESCLLYCMVARPESRSATPTLVDATLPLLLQLMVRL